MERGGGRREENERGGEEMERKGEKYTKKNLEKM